MVNATSAVLSDNVATTGLPVNVPTADVAGGYVTITNLQESATFTLTATGPGGTVAQTIGVNVAQAIDYGAQFVGTWTSAWFECSATPCGGSTGITPVQIGNWTAVITEPGSVNNLLINSSFTDIYATAVTCTDTSVVTAEANDGYGNTYNGSPTVASLVFTNQNGATNLGVCVATAACPDSSDLTVTLNRAIGDLFASGDLLIEYAVSQSCNGQNQVEYYIIEPLVKSASVVSLNGLAAQ